MAWSEFFRFLGGIVDRFGLPGLFLLLTYYFVEKNATQEMKNRIIERYILGDGVASTYPILVFLVLCVLIFFGQQYYYKKMIKTKEDEIERLARWKSEHQEKEIGDLQHVQSGKENSQEETSS